MQQHRIASLMRLAQHTSRPAPAYLVNDAARLQWGHGAHFTAAVRPQDGQRLSSGAQRHPYPLNKETATGGILLPLQALGYRTECQGDASSLPGKDGRQNNGRINGIFISREGKQQLSTPAVDNPVERAM